MYKIPCLDCNKDYVGETCRYQVLEHKRDLKKGNMNNGLVRDNLETNRNFNF